MLSLLRKTSPVRLALIALIVLTIFRLWYITRLGLVADEAYYWLWSKHLAASYRDKGPAVAWAIALSTKLFGDTVFGVRFFGVVFGAVTSWFIFVLARRLYDDRVALWCLFVGSVLPLFAVGSVVMTIDSLSVPLWALGAILFWRILESNQTLDWFWLGLTVGAGFMAKFTNGVQFICIALCLLWSPEHRRLLFSWKWLVAGGAFLFAISPLIWWNVETGWVHVMALHSRSGVTDHFGIHPKEFFRFVGEQFGVISPLLFAGMAVAAVALLWNRNADLRTRFLLSQCLPVFGLFLFFSLNKAGKSNWTAPGLITGIIFTVVYWRGKVAQVPAWRLGIRLALGLACLMTLLLHAGELLHLPHKMDVTHRALGWDDFASHIEKDRETQHATVLIGDHYSVASLMEFYLPGHPEAYLPPAPYGSSQFTLWPGYTVTPATRALFVTRYADGVPEALRQQFNSIRPVEEFWSEHNGRPMNHFFVYLCAAPLAGLLPADLGQLR